MLSNQVLLIGDEMSKFKVGDVVKVVGTYTGSEYQTSGTTGTVVDANESFVIAQFQQQKPSSGRWCTEKWRDPELCCEWFPTTNNELELVSPQNPLDVPGYVPPDGWRIKADDEVVENGDAYSHDRFGKEGNGCGVTRSKIGLTVEELRNMNTPKGGYILTPIPATMSIPVVEPESNEAWYIHAEDGLGEGCHAYLQTKKYALDTLKNCPDETVLYRCVPFAKKTTQITMIGDNE